MGVLLEHVLNYFVTVYTTTMPTEIHLEPFPNHMGREAKITFRIRSDLPRRPPEREGRENGSVVNPTMLWLACL